MALPVFYVLAAACLAMTLLPFSRREEWWVRAADFPRLQVAVAAVIALVGILSCAPAFSWMHAITTVVLVLAVGHHITAIMPYTPLWPKEMRASGDRDGGTVLSVMVANVLMHNRETGRLMKLIDRHRPDVLLAVETDDWWCLELDARTADWPHKLSHPLDNTYGMFLASRIELVDPEVRFLLKDDIPSIRAGLLLDGGEELDLYALHPEPPSPTEAYTALPRDAELVTVAKEIAERGRSAVVLGDLNDVAWSHTSRLFRRLSRMLDPRIGRGLFSTFHAQYWPLRWPLDHVFASDDFLLDDVRRLGAFGSDHFPILMTLRLARRAARDQTADEPDAADIDEAEDKLERSRIEIKGEALIV
ncbi:MAG: endonuclease [Rhizobiales bacterium]|nr:endonuclease [Hyphomicrobiales bacterium]